MKKFGTPIGAAPGNANEKVGFDGVGTPPLLRSAPGLVAGGLGFGLGFGLTVVVDVVVVVVCEDGCWTLPGPVGFGADCVVVDEELDVELELELEDELELVDEDDVELVGGLVEVVELAGVVGVVEVVVGVEGVVEVEAAATHDSDSRLNGPVTGS